MVQTVFTLEQLHQQQQQQKHLKQLQGPQKFEHISSTGSFTMKNNKHVFAGVWSVRCPLSSFLVPSTLSLLWLTSCLFTRVTARLLLFWPTSFVYTGDCTIVVVLTDKLFVYTGDCTIVVVLTDKLCLYRWLHDCCCFDRQALFIWVTARLLLFLFWPTSCLFIWVTARLLLLLLLFYHNDVDVMIHCCRCI